MQMNRAGWISLDVVKNMSMAVGHVPDDVLISIFTIARFECGVAPGLLASVCHRWLAIVDGTLGALLWSHIRLDVTPETEAITLARETMRCLDRSHTYPISYHLKASSGVPAESIDILSTITRASMSRCIDLDIASLHKFRSWFPLDGPLTLKRLQISGTSWHVEEGIPPFTLLETPCPSLSKLELSLTNPGSRIFSMGDSSDITPSLLANVSKLASITHLRITVDTILEVWDALASFHHLQHLDWYHTGSDDGVVQGEGNGAAAVSLPKLERFRFHDRANLHALSMLSAPLLRHLELIAYPGHFAGGLGHWTLLNPVRFPNLQTMGVFTEDREMYRIVSAIEGHLKLRNVCWQIQIQSMSGSIRALSSLLRKTVSAPQPSPMLLHQLDWFSISPAGRIPAHLQSKEVYAEIARELAKFADIWDVLPAERRPNFTLCLSRSFVEASQEIARVVQKYPDIVLPRIHPFE
jgi:hypothetical protein